MTAMRPVVALVDVVTLQIVCFVARFAFAVVPARHVHTVRGRIARVQASCTFIEIPFARLADVAHAACAHIRGRAYRAIQTLLRTNRC